MIMENLRLVGIAFSIILFVYLYRSYGLGRLQRGVLLLGTLLTTAICVLSVYPPVGDFLLTVFRLKNRLFAVLVFSNLMMLVLFFAVLNRSGKLQRDLATLVRRLSQDEYRRRHQQNTSEGKIAAIVIPAYKEEENILNVLSALPENILDYQIVPIVVDDGSHDQTEKVVRSTNVGLAKLPMNRGQGGALQTGFDIAIEAGADIIITMDADGQHRPEDLGELLTPIANGEADMVIGSRFLGEYAEEGSNRHIGIVGFSIILSILVGQRIKDCTSGYRAIVANRLQQMTLIEERFNAPELIVQAANQNLRILEVPVKIQSRAQGQSKKPGNLGYPVGFGLALLGAWMRCTAKTK